MYRNQPVRCSDDECGECISCQTQDEAEQKEASIRRKVRKVKKED